MEDKKVNNYFIIDQETGAKIPIDKEDFNKINNNYFGIKKPKTTKKKTTQKVNITVAWTDILKVRERVKLICLLGIVFAFVSFAQNTIFQGLGLQITLTGLFVLVFGVFYVLNEKQSEILKLKIAGKIKSTFKNVDVEQ